MIVLNLPGTPHATRLWLGRGGQDLLAERMLSRPGPRLLLTESRVARSLQRQQEALLDLPEVSRLVLKEGEAAKNSAGLLTILSEMAGLGMERSSPLLAFGGGVIGDMGGLAASMWKRGVPLLLAPTSLLAMVDACLGGKTAINFAGIRNSVGAFWPACEVVADLDCLATLPQIEWICGFGELLKTAWLSEDSWAADLERNPLELFRADHPDLEAHVTRALEFKLQVVAADPREAGRRALLNLGHSFAHALEAHALEAQDFAELKHGQAVLLGMLAAVRGSRLAKVAGPASAKAMEERLLDTMSRLGVLPAPWLAELNVDELIDWMRQDKKVRGGKLGLVLLRKPGEALQVEVDSALLKRIWEQWREIVA